MEKQRILVRIFISLPLILSILYIFYLYNNVLIIDFNSREFEVSVYSDTRDSVKGNSKILEKKISKNELSIKYILGDKRQFPYCGISIKQKNGQDFNLSNFDYVELELNPFKCDDFVFCLLEYIDGFSNRLNDDTHRLLLEPILIDKSHSKYKAELKYFKTPLWWYNSFDIKKQELPEIDFQNTVLIQLQNFPYNKKNEEYTIQLKSIVFKRDPDITVIIVLIFILCFYSLLFFYYIRKMKNGFEYKYEKLSLQNSIDEDCDILIEYIGKNYMKMNFSLSIIEKETGISTTKIRAILSEKFNNTFKQYLTNIRMSEAKRLLIETDRSVADIAIHIGYRHSSTFARIFKDYTGLGAIEYRGAKR